MKNLFLLLICFSHSLFSQESTILEPSTTTWAINNKEVKIVRDPIEHISINEDCFPITEKNCQLSKALKKYLTLEANEENLEIINNALDSRPANVICEQFLNGQVYKGEMEIRGRFPKFEDFCQFSDESLISLSSLIFYQGPTQLPEENQQTKQ